jgi:hypothetical protein
MNIMAPYSARHQKMIDEIHDPNNDEMFEPIPPELFVQVMAGLDRLFAKDELEEKQAAERAKSETKQNQPVLAAV